MLAALKCAALSPLALSTMMVSLCLTQPRAMGWADQGLKSLKPIAKIHIYCLKLFIVGIFASDQNLTAFPILESHRDFCEGAVFKI